MPADGVVHIIDDDIDVRQSLAFLLSVTGLAVRIHESAVSFLEVLPELKSVMTGNGDVPLAVEAMKAGAVDSIEKPFEDEIMLSAVRAALARHVGDLERSVRATAVQERIGRLSDREREVLDRLVTGKANKVIAYELGISPRTVEVYRANVMTKMQAESLSELVRMALIESRPQ
jgi:two-component system response regulator FixJ